MFRLTFIFGFCICAQVARAQVESLSDILVETADFYRLKLVYSPTSIPDTLIEFKLDTASSAKFNFSRLTTPFGLRFAMLSDKVIVSSAQKLEFSASGFVEDAKTKERLVGATVQSLSKNTGTFTNGYGYFALDGISSGEKLLVKYLGYPADTITVVSSKRKRLLVRLQPSYELTLIEVLAPAVVAPTFPTLGQALPRSVLDDSEFVTGDRDINVWLRQMPAIQSAAGGFGGFSIRGADPNHNLVLVDDATLYLPSHAAGLVSAVPGKAIRSLELHKNAGPAKYGDRVGGVLDLRLKDGSREGRRSSVSLGSTDFNGSTEGPIGKGSYFLMGRRGLTDFWLTFLRPSIQPDQSSIPNIDFRFSDITGKLNYPIGNRHRLYASFYRGIDSYEDRDETFSTNESFIDGLLDQGRRRWSNSIATLRHNVALGSRWFVNSTLTLSDFEYRAEDFFVLRERINTDQQRITSAEILFQTKLRDIGWKQDAEYSARPDIRLKFGIDIVAHQFQIGTNASEITQAGSTGQPTTGIDTVALPITNTYDASSYVSVHYEPGDKWKMDFGARLSSQIAQNDNYFALLPRLKAEYEFSERVLLRATGGASRQYIHSISTENPGLPRDLWVPSVDGVTPTQSRYATIGASYVVDKKLNSAVTMFYQDITGLSRFPPGFIVSNLENWNNQVQQGQGSTYGIESELRVPLNPFVLDLAYTYSKSTREYEDPLGGEVQIERYRLDRRHFGTLAARYLAGDKWSFGATWRIGTGLPTRVPRRNPAGPTLPDSNVPLTNWWSYDGPQIEFKPYHSLDLGIRRVHKVEDVEYRFSFGVQNIYVRKNPLLLNLQRIPDAQAGESQFRLTQVLMLPILPFIRYSASF